MFCATAGLETEEEELIDGSEYEEDEDEMEDDDIVEDMDADDDIDLVNRFPSHFSYCFYNRIIPSLFPT